MPGIFSPIESAPIPDAQQVGGVAPGPTLLTGVKDALAATVPAIREKHIRNLQEDVQTKTSALEEALTIQKHPFLAASHFSKEALQNPTTAAAFKEYNEIKLAVEQGALPQRYALERLRVIQDTAIANAPEFEDEIRAGMVQATGQDPQKTMYSQLLAEAKTSKSGVQKGQEEIEKFATVHGFSVDEARDILHQRAVAEMQATQLQQRKISGEYGVLDLEGEVNNKAGTVFLELASQARTLITQKGGLSPQDIQTLTLQAGATYAAAIGAITTGARGVDAGRLAQATAPLKAQYEATIKMLGDGTYQTLLTSTNAINSLRLENKIMSMPKYALAYQVGNKPGFLSMIELQNKIGENPALGKLLSAVSPTVAGFESLSRDMMLDEYNKMGTGELPSDPQARLARTLAAASLMQSEGNTDEKYTLAVDELGKLGEELKWTTMGTSQVVRNAVSSPALKAAVAQTQVSVTAGLAKEWATLVSRPAVNAKRFYFDNGILKYDVQVDELTGFHSSDVADAKAFADRFNRANKISAAHAATGTLPKSRYGGVTDYWETVTMAPQTQQPAAPQQPTVIEWGRDDKGNPIRITK